jgi:hypothetical protein
MNAAQHQKWNQSQWICRCHVTPVKTSLFNSYPKRINLLFNLQLQCLTFRWPFGNEETRFLAARLQRNFCTNAQVSLFFYICRMIRYECMGVDLLATAPSRSIVIKGNDLSIGFNFATLFHEHEEQIQWLTPELGVQTLKVQMQMNINAWKWKS